MALDTKCKDRSYLFGRLLAIADVLERSTYDKGEDGKRQTNAMRLMSMFSRTPYKTWKVLDERLIPYRTKLGAGAIRYDKLIQEVMDIMEFENFTSSASLDGSYLLGYYCQKKELYTKKTDEETTENTEKN